MLLLWLCRIETGRAPDTAKLLSEPPWEGLPVASREPPSQFAVGSTSESRARRMGVAETHPPRECIVSLIVVCDFNSVVTLLV